jgi:hypothetical protein
VRLGLLISKFGVGKTNAELRRPAMTTDQGKQLRADFRKWTGGFKPEDGRQIDQYIECSLGVHLDPDNDRLDLLLWLKEPKPLDPKQSFVAARLTREDIASNLSAGGREEGQDIEPTDPRLTDEFCRAFAKEYGEILCDEGDIADSADWTSFIKSELDELNR